jgi:hypothetical protein
MIKLKSILTENTNKSFIVYHGTDIKFNKFNLNKSAQGIIWFTSDKDKILKGEAGASGKGYIVTAQVTINNPAEWNEYQQYMLGQLKNMGYDGVILPENNEFDCFVFSLKQIKILKVDKIQPTNIDEAKKLNLDNKEDAAEYFIRQSWKLMPPKDRYDEYQFFLWADNESNLQDIKEKIAQKLFPNDDSYIEKFDDIISDKLDVLNKEKTNRLSKKINPNDPLAILKSVVTGKTYEGAKQSLLKNSIGGAIYKGGKITDEEADTVFNRLYRSAMGETMYNLNSENRYGRLSDLRRNSNSKDFEVRYMNDFIDHYAGHNADRFADKVKVYRGVNNPHVPIRPGDFITFDKDYAASYKRGKYGTVIEDILNSKDLIVYIINRESTELVYWPEGHQIKKYTGEIPTFKQFFAQANYTGFPDSIQETYYNKLSDDEHDDLANTYFSIGQDENVDDSFCWIWDWSSLSIKTKQGGTHACNFGYNTKDHTYSGWYDPDKNIISIVFPDNELRKLGDRKPTEDDIPQQVYKSLISKFSHSMPEPKFVVFENKI